MKPAAAERLMLLKAAILAAVVVSGGCSRSGMESEVSGRVTLDGRLVGPGTVVFAPVDGTTNPADGAIQLDGSYYLKTSREVGLRPGRYKASVSVFDQPEVKPGERSMTPARLVTPQKYSDTETSGLEYTVEPGENNIDIRLTST